MKLRFSTFSLRNILCFGSNTERGLFLPFVIFSILSMPLLMSCRDDESVFKTDNKKYTEIVLSFPNNEFSLSRTALVDPGTNGENKKHHVTRVALYIYKDSICEATAVVDWVNNDKNNHKIVFDKFAPDATYTIIAVGLDDERNESGDFKNINSVEAYGLYPEELNDTADNVISPAIKVGSCLSDAKAILRKGLKAKHIASSELFSGFIEKKGRELDGKCHTITMYRRVAGVMGYFKNVPEKIDETSVKYLAIRLCGDQNTSIDLIRKVPEGYDVNEPNGVPDNKYNDYKDSPIKGDYGSYLMMFELNSPSTLGPGGSGGPGGGGGTEPEGPTDPELPIYPVDPKCFSGGVYVLPAKFKDDNDEYVESTIMIELLDKDMSVLKTIKVVKRDKNNNTYRNYPIRANHFYRLGSKEEPLNLSSTPVSRSLLSEIEIEEIDVFDNF